jgi:tRNA (guanine37-N1)-methyltransferase
MKYNIRVNKMSHKIVPVLGDVRTACEELYGKCDRVVMPLPLGAENFLDVAVKCAKPGATEHFYSWGGKDSLYEAAEKAIGESLKKVDREYKITGRRVVLPYVPWEIQSLR